MRPVAGPSVRPQCAWPMASHRPGKPGARPITGRESGKHGRLPSQVSFVHALAERKQFACLRHDPVELHRRRCCIARGEFDAGGHTDSLLHRRDQVAGIGIEHRPRQRGIAVATEMPVIAALDHQRQFQPKRLEQIVRPWSERDHDLGRIDPALVGFHPPAISRPVQRARVAGERHAAERRKARGISARDAERIAHARGLRPEHRMREHRLERRLQRLRARGVQRLQRKAELCGKVDFPLERREAALAAIDFQPAGLAQEMRGA